MKVSIYRYIETFKDGEEVLILYLLMNSTDWYYVVIGDKDEMLSSPGLMEP